MPDINPGLPAVGQPNSSEEPKIVTALSQLISAVNNVDSDQIADGSIAVADLAAALAQALAQPGDIKISAAPAADTGWLLCDGSAQSRATFAALFNKIGTAFGVGDGSTTFNLPDLRGRVPVGVDGAAARLAGSDALGGAGGEESHTLTTAEMPSHVHGSIPTSIGITQGTGAQTFLNGGSLVGNTGSAGGGGSHNNMQPYQVVNYQIKT